MAAVQKNITKATDSRGKTCLYTLFFFFPCKQAINLADQNEITKIIKWKRKLTNGNNGDGGAFITSSDGQEPTVGGMAEQVRRNTLGRGVGVDAVEGAGQDNGAGGVSDGDDPVSELSTLDSDVAKMRVGERVERG
jgi:hypothetical protein